MSKRFIPTAALVGLVLAGSALAADSQDQRVQRQLRSHFGLVVETSARGGQEEGVVVSEVLPDSPAAKAGLRVGDVITRIGRRTIEDFRDLANAIVRFRQGERVSLRVQREGQEQSLSVTSRMPGADEDNRDGETRYGRANGETAGDDTRFQRLQQTFRRLEARLQSLERHGQYGRERGESTDQAREYQRLHQRLDQLEERVQQAQRPGQYGRLTSGAALGVQTREWRRQADSRQGGSAEEGVMVTAVDPESLAAESGLRRGDIITRVDDRNVTTSQELRQALQRGSGQEMTLEVLRGSRQMELNVRMEGGSGHSAQNRRFQRLQERIERLETRLREIEQNQ